MRTNRYWSKHRLKHAPVLYIGLEGESGIPQRKKAYQVRNGYFPSGFLFMLQALDIRIPAHRAELIRAIRAAGWTGGVVCIDTLNRAAPGMDENDSKSMGEVISAAKAIQAELGGLVLVVHHTGKDATKGLRGHSSLHAALDCAIEVSRDGDQRQWSVHKSKDGEDGEAHPFRLEVVEIGTDEDDEPITSCVVIPDDTKTQFRKVLPPKSGNMRVVWDALGEILREAGDIRPTDAPDRLPIGRPTVTLNKALEGTRERLACDPKRKTERAQQALTGLHAKGLIVIDGGFVWVA